MTEYYIEIEGEDTTKFFIDLSNDEYFAVKRVFANINIAAKEQEYCPRAFLYENIEHNRHEDGSFIEPTFVEIQTQRKAQL
jgi:hypothetical protein